MSKIVSQSGIDPALSIDRHLYRNPVPAQCDIPALQVGPGCPHSGFARRDRLYALTP
jgi:hypothetical protein